MTSIRLEGRSQFLILDFVGEVFTRHDTVEAVMKQLVQRKSKGHLVVAVVKGYKSKMVPVDSDLIAYADTLKSVMAGL